MIRIRMPAIREIKGDSEMPATIEVDSGITIGLAFVTVSLRRIIHVAWSLRRLAAPPEECPTSVAISRAAPEDVPFALLYLHDPHRKQARLAGAAGMEMGKTESPRRLEIQRHCA